MHIICLIVLGGDPKFGGTLGSFTQVMLPINLVGTVLFVLTVPLIALLLRHQKWHPRWQRRLTLANLLMGVFLCTLACVLIATWQEKIFKLLHIHGTFRLVLILLCWYVASFVMNWLCLRMSKNSLIFCNNHETVRQNPAHPRQSRLSASVVLRA
ncbi:TPA: hypothetical protein ACFP4Y_000845 [Neisseria bacilliformis]